VIRDLPKSVHTCDIFMDLSASENKIKWLYTDSVMVDSDGGFVQTGSGEDLDEDFGPSNTDQGPETLGWNHQIRSKPSCYEGDKNAWKLH
jgi:hypothetical protein